MGNIWWSQGKGSKTWKTGPNGTVCNNLGHITYRYAVCVPINIGTESSLWACMGNGLCARKWQMFYGKWHSIVSVPSSLTSSLQDHTHTTGWGNYNHHPGVGTGPRGTPSCQQFCLCAPTQPGLKLWGQRWVFFLQNILLGVSVFEIILPLDYPVVKNNILIQLIYDKSQAFNWRIKIITRKHTQLLLCSLIHMHKSSIYKKHIIYAKLNVTTCFSS